MARGPRKSVDNLIAKKEEVIEVLEMKLKKERDELEVLKEEKKLQEVENLHKYILGANLTSGEAIEILREHVQPPNEPSD